MDFAKLIDRVKNILMTPKTEWPVIAGESATVPDLYKNYIVVLAAIPAVLGFIKSSIIGSGAFGITVRTGIGAGLTMMVLTYAVALGVIYLMALLIDAFAPNFGGEKNPTQAMKAAAYAYTASWVAGAGVVVPWLGTLIALAGAIYSIYLLYLGLPHTMKCPPERAGGYAAVVVVIGWLVGMVAGMVLGGIFLASAGTSAILGSATLGSGNSTVTVDANSGLGKLAAMGQKMEAASKQMDAAQKSGDSQAQADAAGKMLGTLMGGGDQVEALAPDRLKAFVPDSLAGLKRTSLSSEKNGAMGMQVSTARARYGNDQGQELELEIVDMGSAKGVMALAGWANVESEQQTDHGYEKTYKQGGRLVHEQWDSQSRYGEFSLVLGDRFTVKVSGNADSIDAIKAAVGTLNLGGLEALKGEGVKRG